MDAQTRSRRDNHAWWMMLFVIASIVGIGFLGEFRLRSFVDYPWLHDRGKVLDSLQQIENKVDGNLDQVSNSLQQIERKVDNNQQKLETIDSVLQAVHSHD